MLELATPDTIEATRIILNATAEKANGHAPDEPDLAVWRAAQRWLERDGSRDVTIPYAGILAGLVPADQVRMRRDFTQLLTLIQAHAVLYQRQRERTHDGRIIADERDYRAIYELAAPIFKAIAASGVTPSVRETVEAVRKHAEVSDNALKIADLARMLNLDRSAVQRRVTRALDGGFLVTSRREKQPTKLLLGDPLPDDRPVLPAPEKVFTHTPCTSAQVRNKVQNPHVDAENEEPDLVHKSCTSAQVATGYSCTCAD